ncbi:MAG: cobyrinic acid a,c-diamide synthase, partial [Loigolactobacillus coryniformis]|nr:cobyrinic acid a,c-diamide synthase [Loigolactobacillus coryniformis]
DGQIVDQWTGGYQVRRTFAGYVHVHFYQNPQLLQHLLQEMGAVTRGAD